jgi:branched-chain amino acid transport system substrate-binding protein
LSGGVEHPGKDSENGVRMAIAELNARQPVIGGRAVRFELAAEDDAGHPTQATIVAQRLCDFGIAGVVGHLQSGTTLPASDVYQRCGLPHITPAATNPEVTARGHATTFRVIANDNALGAALALYAADVLKLRRVAVIDDRTAYGKTVADVFRATAESHGMEVVATEFTKDSATDFMAILTNIRAAQPQAIFYGGLDAQAGPLLRQMDQLGMSEVRVLAGDGACTEKLPEMAGHTPAVARVVCATGGVAVNRMPGGSAWRQRYEERFPGQFQTFSPYAYDATMVLADAMRRANSVDPKVYLPALRQTDHQGVTARIRFNSQGDLTQPAVTLNAYRNNVRTPLN